VTNGFDQLILLVVSFLANLFSAFSGGGAGLIQLPLLIFLGLPFSIALATHKIATVALGIGATLRHLRQQGLSASFVWLLLGAGMPGVLAGALVILEIPDRSAEIALGLLTLGLSVYSVTQRELGQVAREQHRDLPGFAIGGGVLFLIGVLNGSLTSGTGLFVTLWLVRWFGLDYRRAVAYTLVLVGVFWNGTGALTLGVLSEIHWNWLPALLAGSLFGGYAGAHLAIAKGNRWIKRAYEVITLLVGVALIVGRQ